MTRRRTPDEAVDLSGIGSQFSQRYDRFGNRWQQNGPNSMILSFTGNNTTNNNRIDGYCYDSAGNLLDPGPCPTPPAVHLYAYDAENRLTSVDGGASAS
jgi:hypothetical protein